MRALQETFAERGFIYAPAYPEIGRTVKLGQLFVWGTPVHESAFAGDPLNPIRECDVSAMLGGLPVTVLDGESSADIEAAARMVTTAAIPPLAAAQGICRSGCDCVASEPEEADALPRLPRCLVVNGSLIWSSAAQIAFARTHGCFDDGWVCLDQQGTGSGLNRALHTGEIVRGLLNRTLSMPSSFLAATRQSEFTGRWGVLNLCRTARLRRACRCPVAAACFGSRRPAALALQIFFAIFEGN